MTENMQDEVPENDSFEAQIAEFSAKPSNEKKEKNENQFLSPPINPHPRSDLE